MHKLEAITKIEVCCDGQYLVMMAVSGGIYVIDLKDYSLKDRVAVGTREDFDIDGSRTFVVPTDDDSTIFCYDRTTWFSKLYKISDGRLVKQSTFRLDLPDPQAGFRRSHDILGICQSRIFAYTYLAGLLWVFHMRGRRQDHTPLNSYPINLRFHPDHNAFFVPTEDRCISAFLLKEPDV